MIDPGEPTGTSPMVAWCRRLYRCVMQGRLLPGVGYRLKEVPSGTILEIIPGTGGSPLSLYRFKSNAANHIICRSWNGTTEGTVDVLIAKQPTIRNSVTNETLRGVAMTYSAFDLTAQTRLANGGGTTETHYITPPFNLNDLIYALPAKTLVTAGSPAAALTLMDTSNRAWAAF